MRPHPKTGRRRLSPPDRNAVAQGVTEGAELRRESPGFFPPLTNSPPTLHSYKDSSLSSLLFGLLCCLLNIALYLISGEISRLLQQERQLERHDALHYVCREGGGGDHDGVKSPGSPSNLNRGRQSGEPCTTVSGDSDVKTRVVVLNIPYFMSWFSQSLQVCFFFFAIAAIKRRKRRRCASVCETELVRAKSPRGTAPDLGDSARVRFSSVEGDQHGVSSGDRNQSGGDGGSCSCPLSEVNQEASVHPHPRESHQGRRYWPLAAESGGAETGNVSDEISSKSSELVRVSPTDVAAQSKKLESKQQLPWPPSVRCMREGGASSPCASRFRSGLLKAELQQPLIPADEGAPEGSPINTDEANGIVGQESTADDSGSEWWIDGVEGLLIFGSNEERPSESRDGERRYATKGQLETDSCARADSDSGLQLQAPQRKATADSHNPGYSSQGNFFLFLRAIRNCFKYCGENLRKHLWSSKIKYYLSESVAHPFRRHIYTPYLSETYELLKDFVETDVQYASFDELVWACAWIGALYLLQSWTWTSAVGKDGMSVGTVTAIYNINPVFVFLFTVCLYKEGADDCVQIVALILATVGVALIAYHNEGEPTSTSGVLLSVFCAASYGLFEVVFKNYILNGRSNLPLAFIFLIVGIIGVLSLFIFWIPLAILHVLRLEVFPESLPPPLLIILLIFVCVCSCLHTLLLQVSLLLLPSPILVALCSLLSLPAAAAADWLSGGGGGVGGIGSFFIASAFLITSVNEWRIQDLEKARTYRRLVSLAEQHPREYDELRKLMQTPDIHAATPGRRASWVGGESQDAEPSLESIAAHLVAQKKDEDVGAELKEMFCVFSAPDSENEFLVIEEADLALFHLGSEATRESEKGDDADPDSVQAPI
ncbi:hypothetical protein BESB_067560 [Besnoitia besnoiti]|uniref:Multidrug resistance efflux transporter n=1 Tax=Besnoitia besnoiti TaxID=94643 RepID=A0A2A9MGE1_BESBE|nr:hypothetical protein BESB_067560 [Besnoitia besnoiti]PFH34723.1 hypothetical protein BESB_067560 [Besnoitia besnoiti]